MGSPVTLTFSWLVREGVPGITLQSSVWQTLQFNAAVMVLMEAWVQEEYRLWHRLCLSILVAAGPRYQSLLMEEWAWSFCCAQLAWAATLNDGKALCAAPWESAAISILAYRKGRRRWFEHSSKHGLHQQNRGKDQELKTVQILLGQYGSWCTGELYLTLTAETRIIRTLLHNSSFPFFFFVIFG